MTATRARIMACAVALALAACAGGGADGGTGAVAIADASPAPIAPPVAPSAAPPAAAAPVVAASADVAITEGVKWYPGHYLYYNWDAPDEEIAGRLAANPGLRGIMFQFAWRQLEPDRDRYDFAVVQRALDRAARLGTRLALYIEAQAYLPGDNRIPDYIDGEAYGGGRYWLPNGAVNPVLWNAAVAERLANLYREFGGRFDRHPLLAAVTTTESSLALAGDPPPDYVEPYTLDKHQRAMITMVEALAVGFPHTVTIQNLNYPEQIMPALSVALARYAVGLGGPDVFLGDPVLDNAAYRWYPTLAGSVPLGPSVQWDNYVMRRFAGPQAEISVYDLLWFARDRLFANFVFWETRLVPRDFVDELAAMLRSPAFAGDPAGGLASGCPIRYTRCITR